MRKMYSKKQIEKMSVDSVKNAIEEGVIQTIPSLDKRLTIVSDEYGFIHIPEAEVEEYLHQALYLKIEDTDDNIYFSNVVIFQKESGAMLIGFTDIAESGNTTFISLNYESNEFRIIGDGSIITPNTSYRIHIHN